MRAADYARLVALAAIWGASFLFMRVAAPSLGPIWTAEARVLLGGLALLLWFRVTGFDPELRRHGRFYLLVGTVNSAIPFALYAFAAMHASASLLAILNSTAPMFGMVFGALFAGERITARRILGLALGAAGVALVARPSGIETGPLFGWAVAAALGACCGYGITGVLIKRFAAGAPPRGIAAGNQLGAALVLAPLLPLAVPGAAPSALVVANVLGLALLASALAFLIYFRLIADIGAARALTVTFLIPAFGVLWGWLFLGESLPPGILAGGVLIVAGTVLVTRGS
jgi:drug/metabolite transporter (DMT)-like permease